MSIKFFLRLDFRLFSPMPSQRRCEKPEATDVHGFARITRKELSVLICVHLWPESVLSNRSPSPVAATKDFKAEFTEASQRPQRKKANDEAPCYSSSQSPL
jgi:hypothetical protein